MTYDIHKAAGIIIRNRALLVTRSHNSDVFVSPGGKLEAGENAKQAVIRELQEELQLHITEDQLSLFGTFYAEAAGKNAGKKLRMDVFMVDTSDPIIPDHEIAELCWLSAEVPAGLQVGSIFAHDVLPKLHQQGLID